MRSERGRDGSPGSQPWHPETTLKLGLPPKPHTPAPLSPCQDSRESSMFPTIPEGSFTAGSIHLALGKESPWGAETEVDSAPAHWWIQERAGTGLVPRCWYLLQPNIPLMEEPFGRKP